MTSAVAPPAPAILTEAMPVAAMQRLFGLVCLNAFLLFAWLATVAPFFSMTVSDAAGGAIGLYSIMIYPAALLMAVAFFELNGRQAYRSRWYTLAVAGAIAMLAVYGLMRGNAARVVTFDVIAFTAVFGGFVLGRRDHIWRDVRPTITLLLAVSVVLAFAFTNPAILIDRSLLIAQPGSYFEGPLALAPLFCMVAAFDRERRWYYVLLGLSIASFIVYLYFGRRGITVRCGLELIFILFVIPALRKQYGNILRSAVIGFGLVWVLMLYFPFATLAARYAGDAGVLETSTSGNERWNEAAELVGGMNAIELIIGRGMGGSHEISATMETPILDEVEEGEYARLSAHANAANLMLKGGFALLFLCYAPIMMVLVRIGERAPGDKISIAVAFSGLVLLPFQSLEGTVIMTAPWVAFGLGLLMSRSQNIFAAVRLRRRLRLAAETA